MPRWGSRSTRSTQQRFFGIWAGWLVVAIGVLVGTLLVHILFEAEGPVWAIAKLSFKEASRSGLLWLFLLVLVPFAFQNVWMAKTKPVDEVRTLVDVTSLWMAILVVVSAVLFASFYGIPNDIKNLNIYTVVSKPIERFEIVLGRFVGYVALMTLVLAALTGISLVLIANTTLSEKAQGRNVQGACAGPRQAGVPEPARPTTRESNVGREFEYRQYIAGHPEAHHRAVWHYASIPSGLASAAGDRVPVEFTFDIYRMTKGVQNEGRPGQLPLRHAPRAAAAAATRPGRRVAVERFGEGEGAGIPGRGEGTPGQARDQSRTRSGPPTRTPGPRSTNSPRSSASSRSATRRCSTTR